MLDQVFLTVNEWITGGVMIAAVAGLFNSVKPFKTEQIFCMSRKQIPG